MTAIPLSARLAGVALCAALVPACVTINIYFPAAAAEKAADRIIDEVYQIRRQGGTPPPAEKK